MNEIVMIKMEDIYSHKDNPRKDLGDLTELAESIRKQGVMQNLTVMPGHHATEEEQKAIIKNYKNNPTDENRLKNKIWVDSGYTLLIGHRRCAAAKLAGISELPCRIVEGLTDKEQVSIMLEENMQRNDLTILEQADGFQMMLDLGDTPEQIAEKTGFSQSTIYHRLNIAKLDSSLLKEKGNDDSFQLSIKDLYLLEKLKSVESRNKVLEGAGKSADIKWRVEQMLEAEKREQKINKIIELLEAAGLKQVPESYNTERWNKWRTVKNIWLSDAVPKQLPEDVDEECCYYKSFSSIDIVRKKEEKQDPEQRPKTEQEIAYEIARNNREQLREKERAMMQEIRTFVKNNIAGLIVPPKDKTIAIDLFWKAITIAGAEFDVDALAASAYDYDRDYYDLEEDEKNKAKKLYNNLSIDIQMMLAAEIAVNDHNFTNWNGVYNQDMGEAGTLFVAGLDEYGFTFMEEEYYQIISGAHELFCKEDENEC